MLKKEDYVSLETAKLLKEKGFDEPCQMFYCKMHDSITSTSYKSCRFNHVTYSELEEGEILIPSLYEAQKWIWERHKMFVSAAPNPPFTVPLEFFFWIDFPTVTIDNFGSLIMVEHFSSYQQALDAGIRKALELIKED